MDTVTVAAAVRAGRGDTILDMGCGTGGTGLCVLKRFADHDLHLTGVDIQDSLISLARENAKANGHENRCRFIAGDIADKGLFPNDHFDHIVCNPPYYRDGVRNQSPDQSRETAFGRTEIKTWIDAAHCWLKHKGSLTLIHRADALDKILQAAGQRFGGCEIWPLHSKGDIPAIRVIIRLLKNRRAPLVLHPPVILFGPDGQESAVSKRVLRGGEGLI